MVRIFSIGMAVAGAIIGAGFATGKEIAMFFPSYGIRGILFLVVSLCLIVLISYLYFKRKKNFFLDKLFSFFLNIFVACSFSVMLACGGQTLWESFNIPSYKGVILTYILSIIITHFSKKGIYILNFFMLPVMVACISAVFIISLKNQVFFNTSPAILSFSYSGYNLLSLIPFLKKLENEENCFPVFFKGVLLGNLVVLFIGILIKYLIDNYGQFIIKSDIPLLSISIFLNNNIGYIYGILVYGAVLTTAVSCLYSISEYKNKYLVSFLLLIFSFLGFGILIENIYTFFGYIGVMFIIYIILTAFLKEDERSIKNGE